MPLLATIRQAMTTLNCDYYLIGSSDPHQSEYPPSCWQRREAVSGFTGSAGDALIGQNGAWLWTDSRYFLQADKELSNEWQLMRSGIDPSMSKWLKEISQCRVGVDPNTLSIKQAAVLTNVCKLIPVEQNLVDAHSSMSDVPNSPILEYPDELAGESVDSKLSRIRNAMTEKKADYLLISALDEFAWATNTRGTHIDYNPLTIAYAIIGLESMMLFLDAPISKELKQKWESHHILVRPYHDFHETLSTLDGLVWCDPNTTSWQSKRSLVKSTLLEEISPIPLMKAIKNKVEIAATQQAHITDALALVRFFYWLEKHWKEGITECSAAEHLAKLRLSNDSCRDLSFASISAFAEHGAVVHYSPSEETDKTITDQSIYLLDSGGQYWQGGTTDITRCVHLGKPSSEEKKHYTLVLQAHLALRHSVFAEGTTGYALDCVTRQNLWKAGYDFGHGTGHGVSAYLCVHEGPHSISPRENPTPLQVGMTVTNEPGLYIAGKHGIRIENVMTVVTKQEKNSDTGLNRTILGFDDLTLFPYDKSLINFPLLSKEECQRVNDYHQQVWDSLSDLLADKPQLHAWLKEKTSSVKIGDQS